MKKKKKSKFLNLTPLIDVMTTLIIFILIQSSDSPVEVKDDIRLSQTEFADEIKKNSNITVSLDKVTIGEDFELALTNGTINKKFVNSRESRLIEPLYKEISKLRTAEAKKSNSPSSLNMNLAIDKRIPSDFVKKIIYTVTVAGVDNIVYVSEGVR